MQFIIFDRMTEFIVVSKLIGVARCSARNLNMATFALSTIPAVHIVILAHVHQIQFQVKTPTPLPTMFDT